MALSQRRYSYMQQGKWLQCAFRRMAQAPRAPMWFTDGVSTISSEDDAMIFEASIYVHEIELAEALARGPGQADQHEIGQSTDASSEQAQTSASERRAERFLADQLRADQDLREEDALAALREADISVSITGFNDRVWPRRAKWPGSTERRVPGKSPRPSRDRVIDRPFRKGNLIEGAPCRIHSDPILT